MEEFVEVGTKVAPEKFKIVVLSDGPYLIYGNPKLRQQFIMNNEDGHSWVLKYGKEYSTKNQPTALCRCGASACKPYCDGAHMEAEWTPELTCPRTPLLDGAEKYIGPTLTLTDNIEYCAYVRFCDAKGRVWNLVGKDGEEARELTIREANHCIAGRLRAWGNETGEPFEPELEPGLALIQDPPIKSSGPLWVHGGIKMESEDGMPFETRNRVTLCRCGASSNKPYCNGAHASIKFDDGLPKDPRVDGEEW